MNLLRMERKLKQAFEQANIATKPAKAEEPVVKVTYRAAIVTSLLYSCITIMKLHQYFHAPIIDPPIPNTFLGAVHQA